MRDLDVRRCKNVTTDVSFAHLPALATLRCMCTFVGDAAIATLPVGLRELDVYCCVNVTEAARFRHLAQLRWWGRGCSKLTTQRT